MNELALFAGAGGGILAGNLLGWSTVCAVERDAYAAQILAQRQNDGTLEPFPIWSDVETFNGSLWRGIVDVVSGGFPCQDISVAGKGAGIEGRRSGLWKHMARIVSQVRPRIVFVENSPRLIGKGLALVIGDLAEMGYDSEWFIVSASDCGAPHKRDRLWIVASDNSLRELQSEGFEQIERRRIGDSGAQLADAKCRLQELGRLNAGMGRIRQLGAQGNARALDWPTEPGMGRMADGVANRVDRLKTLGNGQVPRVAATAFELVGRKINVSV